MLIPGVQASEKIIFLNPGKSIEISFSKRLIQMKPKTKINQSLPKLSFTDHFPRLSGTPA